MWLFILCSSSLIVYSVAQTAAQLAAVNTDSATVQQKILDLINDCRRNVNPTSNNMLKMVWNTEAAKTAKAWAEKCTFEHSAASQKTITNSVCGENLYMATFYVTWEDAIKAFCDEKQFFVYGKGSTDNKVTGHYTQLVWYNSYKVGCYATYCPTGQYRWYFVCHQCPGGNFPPILNPYGSGPSCGKCPNNCENRLCTNPCTENDKFTNCESLKSMCSRPEMITGCPASCNCKTEIV